MKKRLLELFALVIAFPAVAAEPDWPQFRGPKRDDVSTDTGLLKSWPDKGPPLAWKGDGVGIGFSSVAVVGDKVLTMGDEGDNCYIFAVSRNDGHNLWNAKVGRSGGGGGYPGPRCTPTVDGDRVFALGQHGDLVCVSLANGKQHWRVNLPKDFKGSCGGWQYARIPARRWRKTRLHSRRQRGHDARPQQENRQGHLEGLHPDGESAGYSSIVISHAGGTKQYVTLTSKGVVSFKAADGKMLWRYGATHNRFADNTANIPTVVLMDNPNWIFASAGYGRGGGMVQLTSAGGKINTKEIYWQEKLNNKHGGVVRVGKYLYGDRDDSGRIWSAEAKTGKIMWTRNNDAQGGGSASLTYADGMLYVRYQNGWVSLVSTDPKAYKLVSSSRVPNGSGNCSAHPVVVGGKLFIREREVIWCSDVKKK